MKSLKFNLIVWKFYEIASTKLAEKCQVKKTVAYQQTKPEVLVKDGRSECRDNFFPERSHSL